MIAGEVKVCCPSLPVRLRGISGGAMEVGAGGRERYSTYYPENSEEPNSSFNPRVDTLFQGRLDTPDWRRT
jgi:hypothetical protein